MNEREAFEAWFKEKSPVGGVNAKLAARDAWLARAAIEADRAQRVPDAEDLKDRLVAISSAVVDSDEREAQAIIRTTLELLASTPAPAQQEPSEAEMVCAEAYQVVGCLLSDLGLFETDQSRKILDNLSEARRVHQDVLPWESAQHQEQPRQERGPMTDAARDVLAERQRQISAEGWTPEHDDEHTEFCAGRGLSELARAAKAYIEGDVYNWPWTPTSFKPSSPRRNLVKAGALILAEIERLDRATTE